MLELCSKCSESLFLSQFLGNKESTSAVAVPEGILLASGNSTSEKFRSSATGNAQLGLGCLCCWPKLDEEQGVEGSQWEETGDLSIR